MSDALIFLVISVIGDQVFRMSMPFSAYLFMVVIVYTLSSINDKLAKRTNYNEN